MTEENELETLTAPESAIGNADYEPADGGAAGKAKKPARKPLRKEVKLAIGVSITVVLLALIVTIVIIAVQTAQRVSQLYLTVFERVDTTVRNDVFIAKVGGEYQLFNGDWAVSSKYAQLTFNEQLNGYLYLTESGEVGVLDLSGKVRYKQKSTMPDLTMAIAFTETTATFREVNGGEGSVCSYSLVNGEKIEALNGYMPNDGTADKYFTVKGERYAAVTVESLGAQQIKLTILSDQGGKAEFTDNAYAYSVFSLKAVQGKAYLLANGTTGVFIPGSGAATTGAYSEVRVNGAPFCSVGTTLYDKSLTAYENFGGPLSAKGSLLSSGGNVYATSGGVKLLKENAALAGDKKTYVLSEGAFFDEKGNKLIEKKNDGGFTLYGDDVVLDGDEARSIDGKKSVLSVVEIVTLSNGTVMLRCADGTVRTVDTVLVSAEKAAELGAPKLSDEKILRMKNGFVFALGGGYYCTADGTVLPLVPGGELVRLGGEKAENFAVKTLTGFETYSMSKTAVTKIAGYAYAGVNFVSDERFTLDEEFRGVVFSVRDNVGGTLYGFIGENGKLTIRPQFSSMRLCNGFIVVGNYDGMYAVADYFGKVQTDWIAADASPTIYKDFVLIKDAWGKGVLFGAQGKEALTGVAASKKMDSYVFKDGAWADDETTQYVQLNTKQGVRVLRMTYTNEPPYKTVAAI